MKNFYHPLYVIILLLLQIHINILTLEISKYIKLTKKKHRYKIKQIISFIELQKCSLLLAVQQRNIDSYKAKANKN